MKISLCLISLVMVALGAGCDRESLERVGAVLSSQRPGLTPEQRAATIALPDTIRAQKQKAAEEELIRSTHMQQLASQPKATKAVSDSLAEGKQPTYTDLVNSGVPPAEALAYLANQRQATPSRTETKEEQVALTGTQQIAQPPVRTMRLATLKHQVKTARGTIDSGISLGFEYYDAGTGRGPVRVISPGTVMDGEYWTVKGNESFKNVVSARLLNPDSLKVYSPEDSKSFARLTGEGGGLMECIYIITRTGTDNRGFCLDNKKNQYRLIF